MSKSGCDTVQRSETRRMGKKRRTPEEDDEPVQPPQNSPKWMYIAAAVLLLSFASYQYQSMLAAAPTQAALDQMADRMKRGEAAVAPTRTTTEMHKAAAKGVAAVQARLEPKENADEVHVEDEDGETPIFKAARAGLHTTIEELVDRGGASIKTKNSYGQTALFVALEAYSDHTNIEAQKVLLVRGSDPNATVGRTDTLTLLQWAVEKEMKDTVELLLLHGACINCQGDVGKTALQVAVDKADAGLEFAKLLIENKANLDSVDADTGSTALHMAVNHQNLPLIRLLVEAGADATIKEDMFGLSPVDVARKKKRNKVLKALGVDP